MAGLASARARGRLGGRKKGLAAKARKTVLIAKAFTNGGIYLWLTFVNNFPLVSVLSTVI
jgi:hypothetical protein